MGSIEQQQHQGEHPAKIPLPETMPAFSSDNPVQALYIKRRGVEKILNKVVGRTMGYSFFAETATKIEKESMLVDRRDSNVSYPTTLETIPSFDEDSSDREAPQKAAPIDDYDKCPELSQYDSDEESDWSLPGIDKTTDIRYVYGSKEEGVFYDDGHFYDEERRERKHALAPKDPRKSKENNTLGFLASQFLICHTENPLAVLDWIRCT